mgnify:CR=1 FL=1
MASVVLVTDLRDSREVALKVLHPELASTVGADRFIAALGAILGLDIYGPDGPVDVVVDEDETSRGSD